jgi:hypothetical protein
VQVELSYTHAVHGNEYEYKRVKPFVDTYSLIEDKTWKKQAAGIRADYQFTNNSYVFAGYSIKTITGYDVDNHSSEYYLDRFTPPLFHGKTHTIHVGFNTGF